MTTCYCTLADVRAEINATSTVDDQKVMRGIRQISSRIDRKFKRLEMPLFAPCIGTQEVALAGDNINSAQRTLMLRTPQNGTVPLLELTSVTVGTTSLGVGTNVRLYPPPRPPYYQLQLIGSGYRYWYNYCDPSFDWTMQFVTVGGVWGYSADYARAWLAVDTITDPINASVVTLTVTDVDGLNAYAESPRISAGNLIQIDDEWMDVVATNPLTNTVTVVRGVNGSTAAAHADDSAVSVWQVDESVRRCARQVAFQYARIGAFDTARISDFSTIVFPDDWLKEIVDLLSLFANM